MRDPAIVGKAHQEGAESLTRSAHSMNKGCGIVGKLHHAGAQATSVARLRSGPGRADNASFIKEVQKA